MRKCFYIVAFVFCNLIGYSQVTNSTEVGVTEGQLSVSLTGAANYSIPIKVPPGINGIVPQISLVYNSQAGNGMAGYGWNISGISMISRIPSTKFHDGVIDPVDFDALDRFALDGQRLILKSGTSGVYGADGTQYETENFSNLKITSIGVHPNGAIYGPASFKVEYPDGSVAIYGNTNQSRTVMNWGITEWRNPQQIKIFYFYENSNNNLSIGAIGYGSENAEDAINKIIFNYSGRTRGEQAYVGGQNIYQGSIISEIRILGNGVPYRNYFLGYDETSLGYNRLKHITEKTGDVTLSLNSTVFDYDTYENPDYFEHLNTNNLNLQGIDFTNTNSVSGDFDGDSKIDFLLYPITGLESKSKFNLFTNISQNSFNIGQEVLTGKFDAIFPTTFLSAENKLYSNQGITIAQPVEGVLGRIKFTTYAKTNFGIYPQQVKEFDFPTYTTNEPEGTGSACGYSRIKEFPKAFFDGDFNGDGIGDVIVIDKVLVYKKFTHCICCDQNGDSYPGVALNPNTVSNGGRAYFINLDRRNTNPNIVEIDDIYIEGKKVFVGDYNGDGRSDLLVLDNGNAKVYSLNQANNYITLLWSFTDIGITIQSDFMTLLGDYNGDGKMDFCIPQAVNSYFWNFYISTGSGFVVRAQNIGLKYVLGNIGWAPGGGGQDVSEFNYIPSDFNSDGKTDILLQQNYTWRCIGPITGVCDTYYDGLPHETKFRLAQNIGIESSGAPIFSTISTDYLVTGVYRYPIPIITNHNNVNLNLEYGLVSGNKIFTFNSAIDNKNLTRINKITTGNGVSETITYKPLKNEPCGYNCNSVYTDSRSTETYPNMDIILAPPLKVVTQIDKESATVHKKQQFMYYGAVTNFEGLGFLGFRATMSTNWTDVSGTNLISAISKNDIGLRGANLLSYSVLGFDLPQNLTPTSNFISKTINTYNIDNTTGAYEDPLQTNKVFKLKNSKTEQFNGLEGTNSITTTQYDSYNNPIQSTTLLKNGTTTEQTTVTDIGYVSATSSPTYVVGRPSSKTTTITTTQDPDPSVNEETYQYQDHLLTEINKRSSNSNHTSLYISEKNEYDDWGNITKKTISYPGFADRITLYDYDPLTHRFLTKSTDIEGLVTEYSYDQSSGVLRTEKLPSSVNNLVTTYDYDKWFKKIKVTDYLNKKVNIAYTRQAEKTLITTSGEDDSESTELLDDLGRKIQTSVKNIDGSVSYQDFEYDIHDRNTRTREPYFANLGVPQWNTTNFDEYGRVIQIKSFTNKTITSSYNGLNTTVIESTTAGTPAVTNTRTKVSVKNSIGHVISLTESTSSGPLGTINYTYFANGNLATTTFDGNTITVTQDAWGRKTALSDPSAGNYSYSYNGFGETLTETTPNGTTTYNRDNYGKVLTKTISGDLTNSTTTYSYNSDKLLSHTLFQDFASGTTGPVTINYNYEYDDYKRLKKTTETSPQATFEHEIFDFDGFGRAQRESYKATNLSDGKFSEKKIKNTYLKGYHWQILEEGTNNLLWETDAVNARGQLVMAQYGFTPSGGALGKEMHDYDSFGLPSSTKYYTINGTNASTTNPIVSLITDFEEQTGNLTNRNYSFYNVQEDFLYDASDRLVAYPDPIGGPTGTRAGGTSIQVYDNKGRITANNLGEYRYDALKPYRQTQLKISDPTVTNYFNERTPQVITYNAFKKPVTIQEYNIERINFEYNDGNSRSVMYYGDYNPDKNLRKFRKFYAADGSMEIKRNLANNTVEFLIYIGGDGYSAPVVSQSDGTNEKYLYLHRDYQGTILGVSDASGQLIEQRHFDAWGSLIKYWNNTGVSSIPTTAGIMLLDRGYTGHEHLLGVGIINMNGRMYDPKLHRFLSPDNYVQDPSNTQSFNRFAYCLNNPLKFTDYSGESWWSDNWKTVVVIAASVATACVIVASMGTATPLVAAFWAGTGAGLVGGSLGAYLDGRSTQDILLGGFKGAIYGGVAGFAGGFAAMAAPAGAFMGALYGGTTNIAITGMFNVFQGRPAFEGAAISGVLGALAGGYAGFKMASAKGLNPWTGTPKNTVITTTDNAISNAQLEYDKSVRAQAKPTTEANTVLPNDGSVVNVSGNPDFGIKSELLNELPSDGLKYHGNDLRSTKPTWGYKLYDNDGNFLKNGITNKPIPETRYTRAFMFDKSMPIKIQFPTRIEAYQWEYQQNLIQRGPLNLNMH